MPGKRGTVADRLAAKLTGTDDPEGCWIFTGTTDKDGYGRIAVAGRKARAHRVAYELAHGPIPNGLVLDHLCRVPACCNPVHLEAVRQQTNVMRGVSPAAVNAAKTHCAKGHPLSGDNVRTWKGEEGHRRCRTCMNESAKLTMRRIRAERKAALKKVAKAAAGVKPDGLDFVEVGK